MYQELNTNLQATLGPNSPPPPGGSSNSQGASKEALVPDDKGKEEEEKKSSGLNSSASLFQPQSLNRSDNDEERDDNIAESSTSPR